MAGSKVTLERTELNKAFGKLDKVVDDFAPILRDMGEILLNNTRDRFKAGEDVHGRPFAPLTELTKKLKKRNKNKILIDSGALSRELTYQLVNRGLEFGSDRKYAAIHQLGGVIKPKTKKRLAFGGVFAKQVTIPARPFIGLTSQDESHILEMIVDHLSGAFR